MNKEELTKKTEDFMRNNLPKTRPKEAYLRHVLGVRKYAIKLAEIYNADRFFVEMAALLHDVGADAGWEHAHESAKISKKFLSELDISKEIQDEIIKCIKTHSMGSKVETIEQQIIQDADGIIFIEDSYKSFFETYKQRLPLEEARKLSIKKTKGMMNKIKTEEGVKLAKKFLKTSLEYLKTAS